MAAPKEMVYKVVAPGAPTGLVTLDEFKTWLVEVAELTTRNAEQVGRLLERRGSITIYGTRISYQAHYAGLRDRVTKPPVVSDADT